MRVRTAVLLGVCVLQSLSLTLPAAVLAVEPSGGLELSELLPDPATPQTDADDEFVELYNSGSEAVELSGYSLRVGTKTYQLPSQSLPAGEYAVLTSADSPWSLTNDGGTIALLGTGGQELQTTTWPRAKTGVSWSKNADNLWDWAAEPTPGDVNIFAASEPPVPPMPINMVYSSIDITELLPDPASPQTDAADEFVELYNPNSADVNLSGYVLKTGKALSSRYTLPEIIIRPGEYLALKSSQTHLGLTNTGSSAALFDPSGRQLGQAVAYTGAKPGQAWAWSETGWTWTTEPTPGTANIIAAPEASGPALVAKATATKAPSASKAKVASAKTSKSTAKSTSAPRPAPAANSHALLADTAAPNMPWLLFALGTLTIGYIIYEFRHDLLSYYHRLRGYTRRSRQASSATEE